MAVILDIIHIVLTTIALLFTAIQVLLLTRQVRENKKWSAQDAAFKYCSGHDEIFQILNGLVDWNADEFPYELFKNDTEDGKKNRAEVFRILQYFERLSVGILCDYFDEEIVRRNLNRTFVETYKKLRPFILMRRAETCSNVFSHFERVAETWIKIPLNYTYLKVPLRRKNH